MSHKLRATEAPTFTNEEIEFLGEETMTKIIPNFSMSTLSFIGGDYGPFRPSRSTEVPLWLAIQLKKFKKCQIRVPSWMETDWLHNHLQQERDDEKFFKPIPEHYIEISTLILDNAEDDVENADTVRDLLRDIVDIRASKIRAGLLRIEAGTDAIKLNNISAMELNTIRAVCLEIMDQFRRLSTAERRYVQANPSYSQLSQPSSQSSQSNDRELSTPRSTPSQDRPRKLRKYDR